MSEENQAEERYENFLAIVNETGIVWALENDEGFVLMCDDKNNECLPFWPDEKSCGEQIVDDWQDCQCQGIPIEEFVENWLPGISEDGFAVVIHPTLDEMGLVIDAEQLLSALSENLSN